MFSEAYNLWSSLCGLLQPPATSSLLGPSILFSSLFSHALSVCSSVGVRDQVSHQYKTTGKIIALYVLMFSFYKGDGKTNDSELEGFKRPPNLICS
jgi:hypothetical protein